MRGADAIALTTRAPTRSDIGLGPVAVCTGSLGLEALEARVLESNVRHPIPSNEAI
jgi:hypothetical protein